MEAEAEALAPTNTNTNTNPRYEMIKDAAQLLKKELAHIWYVNSEPFPDEDAEGNLENEMLLLRSTLEYFYRTGWFPNAFPEATFDLAATLLFMPVEEYLQKNCRYRENFMNRVFKICNRLEPLETIREQDAFELGIRVWGTMNTELIRRRLELELRERGGDGEVTDEFPSSSSSPDEVDDDDDDDDDGDDDDDDHDDHDGDDKDDDGENLMSGVLEKYPALKRATRLRSSGAKMPEVLKEIVEKGAEKLGEERMNEMDEQWKAVQIEKLQRFLVKIIAMRIQASYLLDELQKD